MKNIKLFSIFIILIFIGSCSNDRVNFITNNDNNKHIISNHSNSSDNNIFIKKKTSKKNEEINLSNYNENNMKIIWKFRNGNWESNLNPPNCPEEIIKTTPVDITLVSSILYPGQVRGNEYKAHGGFRFDNSNNNKIEVIAPIDGHVISASRYLQNGEIQYMFEIINSCGIMYRLDHLNSLSDKFQKIVNKLPIAQEGDSRTTNTDFIEVSAGEIIAYEIGIKNNIFFDFGVYDLRSPNELSKNPSTTINYSKSQAFYGVCWLDLLPQNDMIIAKKLNGGDSINGKKSDYCK